jgi:FHA domain/Bacterial regulatory protein, Fis family
VFVLEAECLTIGRAPENRVVLADPSVSRQHCVLDNAAGAFRIKDLGSHNGTCVNGVPVGERSLQHGDEIKVGRSVFRFLVEAAGAGLPSESVRFEPDALDERTMLLLDRTESVYLKPDEALAGAAPMARAARGYRILLRIAAALHSRGGQESLADQLLDLLFGAMPARYGAILLFESGPDPVLARSRDRSTGAGAVVDVNRKGQISRRRNIAGISQAARACLMDYNWPGNVRELANAIESAVVLGSGELITPQDLPEGVLEAACAPAAMLDGYHGALKQHKADMIVKAIEEAGGRITEAARALNLHPNYVHRLIRNLGLRSQIRKSAHPDRGAEPVAPPQRKS